MIRKFAKADILDVRFSSNKLSSEQLTDEGFAKLAKPTEISDDGYLYVTVRAISSRVNKNNDGWPSLELARTDPGYGYKTFEGRPIFVDHNNDNPDRTRGVVVSSTLHVEDKEKASSFDPYYSNAPAEHLPPTWVELMLEVDAQEFPKLAEKIIKKEIDSVSMGANIDKSKCSVCGHEAENPTEYCSHVKMKGATFEIESSDGTKSHKKAYEDCYGVNFFEISFVFDPADETALVSDMSAAREAAVRTVEILEANGLPVPADIQKQAAGVFDQEDPHDPRNVVGDPEFDERAEEPAVLQQSEPEKVNAWQLQQFMSLGLSGEEAEEAVARGLDWREVGEFLQAHPGASASQAIRILTPLDHVGKEAAYDRDLVLMTKQAENEAEAIELFQRLKQQKVTTRDAIKQVAERFYSGDFGAAQAAISRNAKVAIGPPGRDHHNLDHHRQDVERERQLNHEPQADKMTAPEDVDTMRPEIICKNCGSTVEPDSAGQLICQECGFEVEPEGLDNPDLEMARDIDLRQDETEQRNPEGEMQTELEHDKGETEIPSKSPVRPVAPISSTQNDHVKDEMKFSDVQDAELQADPEVVAKVAAFMEKQSITVEDEIELARILNESEDFEGSPTIYDTAEAIERVAATQDNADSRTDIKVNTPKKRPVTSPAAQAASEKILSDQLSPVESKFEVLAETESEETSNEDTDMADKTADREVIKREETDGSGVKRTEEITKEYGPMGGEGDEPVAEGEETPEDAEAEGEEEAAPEGEEAAPGSESAPSAEETDDTEAVTESDPLAEEEKVPAMAAVEEGKLMAALKLAKLASSVGVISADEELEFAGELETSETLAEIEARTKMLESVKEAGLSKRRAPVVAGRVPSFKSASTFTNDVDDADDEALFL